MPTPSNSISAYNMYFNYFNWHPIIYQNALLSDLILIQNQINQFVSNSFVPTNAFIITFQGLTINSKPNDFVEFQVMLSSDSISSFVTINYCSCPFTNFLTQSGLYFLNNGAQNIVSIVNPCTSSNVGFNGLWIFDVTGK